MGWSTPATRSFLTDFDKTGPGTIDTDEVDPVAEAEVYIAYGRDAQAEEILKEAMARDKNRHEIALKLLEIYHARKSATAFETVAKELHARRRRVEPAVAEGRGHGRADRSAPTRCMPAPRARVSRPGRDRSGAAKPDLDFDVDRQGRGRSCAAPAPGLRPRPRSQKSARRRRHGPARRVAAPVGPRLRPRALGRGAHGRGRSHRAPPRKRSPRSTSTCRASISPAKSGGPGRRACGFQRRPRPRRPEPRLARRSGGGGGGEAVGTKLELAKAYLEIGDKDGAREILHEVATRRLAPRRRKRRTSSSPSPVGHSREGGESTGVTQSMRIALGLEYDGSAFCGWQTQPGGCGVQDHLQARPHAARRCPIEVTAAGRTDTGVHATAQVVHFDTKPCATRTRGCAAPIRTCTRALAWCGRTRSRDEFHARYSALSRTYRYLLLDDGVAPAILRDRVGWYHKPLDVDAMASGAQALVGEHDFSAFRDAQCQAKSPVRDLREASRGAPRHARRLHLPRQRVPAPHDPQHRGLARLRGRGKAAARMDRASSWRRATGATPRPRSRPTGSTSRASSMIRRSAFPPSATRRSSITAMKSDAHAHQDLRHSRSGARARRGRGGRRCDRLRLLPRRARATSTAEGRGEIIAALPPFVMRGGTFRERDARSAIARSSQRVPLDLLQFQGDETPDFCARFGKPFVRAVRMEEGVDLVEYAHRFSACPGAAARCARAGRSRGERDGLSTGRACRAKLPLPLILSGGLTARERRARGARSAALGRGRVERCGA